MILVDEAVSSGCRKAVACDDLGIDIKTHQRWTKSIEDKRHGPLSSPANKLTEQEKDAIIKVATSKEFMDLSPRQIVPRLADQGKYLASESSFYRILKERDLLVHRSKTKEPTRNRPQPLIATASNQIYSWDITYLRSSILGRFYYLYMFMDIYSRKIVGWNVHETESSDLSSALIDDICARECIGRDQLILHSDNGSSMKGATMLATLQRLGVVPSFSRPRVSDDNPYSESLFKTMKYCPDYPSKPFSSLEEAKAWVGSFVEWYNRKHLHSGIKFVTPDDRHEGKDEEILARRKIVYETAKLKNPNRWSAAIRDWSVIKYVPLNYLQKEDQSSIKNAS